MVSDMFLFIFIFFDGSSNSQHHILRNIESEFFLLQVFRSSVSCPISSSLYIDLSQCTRHFFPAFFFLTSYPSFIFIILWVTYVRDTFFSFFRSFTFFHFHRVVFDLVLIWSTPVSFHAVDTVLSSCFYVSPNYHIHVCARRNYRTIDTVEWLSHDSSSAIQTAIWFFLSSRMTSTSFS